MCSLRKIPLKISEFTAFNLCLIISALFPLFTLIVIIQFSNRFIQLQISIFLNKKNFQLYKAVIKTEMNLHTISWFASFNEAKKIIFDFSLKFN